MILYSYDFILYNIYNIYICKRYIYILSIIFNFINQPKYFCQLFANFLPTFWVFSEHYCTIYCTQIFCELFFKKFFTAPRFFANFFLKSSSGYCARFTVECGCREGKVKGRNIDKRDIGICLRGGGSSTGRGGGDGVGKVSF